MATIDIDTIVKSISDLSYSDLRMLAASLADVIDGSFENTKIEADDLVPVLFDWSKGWEPVGA